MALMAQSNKSGQKGKDLIIDLPYGCLVGKFMGLKENF